MQLLYLYFSDSARSDCIVGSGSSTVVLFENLLTFYLPFCRVYNFLFLFPEYGGKQCCPVFGVINHKSCAYHPLIFLNFNKMFYYSCMPLKILVNEAKHIHPLLIFSISSKYISFIKSLKF